MNHLFASASTIKLNAFVLNKNFHVQELIEIISKIDQNLIRAVKVFDVYEGENIPKDKKSVAINVTIQADNKTLMVLAKANHNIVLSSNNLKKTKVVRASDLCTYDIMNANKLLVLESSVKVIEETLNK